MGPRGWVQPKSYGGISSRGQAIASDAGQDVGIRQEVGGTPEERAKEGSGQQEQEPGDASQGVGGPQGSCRHSRDADQAVISQKGRKLSSEHRAKLSAANKTSEARARVSAATKGRKHTHETRAEMSAAHKGKILTPEHRAKLYAAHKGKILTPEHRASYVADKGKSNNHRPGNPSRALLFSGVGDVRKSRRSPLASGGAPPASSRETTSNATARERPADRDNPALGRTKKSGSTGLRTKGVRHLAPTHAQLHRRSRWPDGKRGHVDPVPGLADLAEMLAAAMEAGG